MFFNSFLSINKTVHSKSVVKKVCLRHAMLQNFVASSISLDYRYHTTYRFVIGFYSSFKFVHFNISSSLHIFRNVSFLLITVYDRITQETGQEKHTRTKESQIFTIFLSVPWTLSSLGLKILQRSCTFLCTLFRISSSLNYG